MSLRLVLGLLVDEGICFWFVVLGFCSWVGLGWTGSAGEVGRALRDTSLFLERTLCSEVGVYGLRWWFVFIRFVSLFVLGSEVGFCTQKFFSFLGG